MLLDELPWVDELPDDVIDDARCLGCGTGKGCGVLSQSLFLVGLTLEVAGSVLHYLVLQAAHSELTEHWHRSCIRSTSCCSYTSRTSLHRLLILFLSRILRRHSIPVCPVSRRSPSLLTGISLLQNWHRHQSTSEESKNDILRKPFPPVVMMRLSRTVVLLVSRLNARVDLSRGVFARKRHLYRPN